MTKQETESVGTITVARSSNMVSILAYFNPPIAKKELSDALGLLTIVSADKDDKDLIKATITPAIEFGRSLPGQDRRVIEFFKLFGSEHGYEVPSETIHQLGSQALGSTRRAPSLMNDSVTEARAAQKYAHLTKDL
jgi:hypothetical protein